MKCLFSWLLSVAVIVLCMLSQMVFAADKVVVLPLQGKFYILPTKGSITPPPTVESAGQIWMDRNLGASQVATNAFYDVAAYGDLYQWGRYTDGHEKRISGTTSTVSSSDQPGHASFITVSWSSNYDWRWPQNTNLWQGVYGGNNPCPPGFRLPTATEWETERLSWSSKNAMGAFDSPLKLVTASYRSATGGNYG